MESGSRAHCLLSPAEKAIPLSQRKANRYRCLNRTHVIVEESDRTFVFDNSGSTPTIFSFENDKALSSAASLPPFLETRLLEPRLKREAEQKAIADILDEVNLPNEESGTYSGRLCWLSEHYMVQEAGEVKIRHDRLLLLGNASVGDFLTVTYQDGAGSFAS